MKKIFVVILYIFISIGTFAASGFSKGKEKSVLPTEMIKLIEKSDSVSWILIDPMSPDSVRNSYAMIGERLAQVTDTCEDRRNAIKATLSYPKSLEDKDISKDCTFLPDIACVFVNGTDSLTFSYSFYCDVCRFEYKENCKEYDGELIREAIMQIALEIFPKDRYIRKIAGKSR